MYFAPVWSPDGRFVVFESSGNGLFWARADAGGQPQPLLQSAPGSLVVHTRRQAAGVLRFGPSLWTKTAGN